MMQAFGGRGFAASVAAAALLAQGAVSAALADPLPSWNAGGTKSAIIEFVEAAQDPDADGYVPEPERIAVFDNDGTLWSEQPLYTQVLFALARAKELGAEDPSWAKTPALKAAAEGDMKALEAGGEKALFEVLIATHTDISVDDFEKVVGDWIAKAKHPKTGRLFTDMVYQPMLELLSYLRDSGFETYIVSGGGADFMRAFADEVYGVPDEQVIGTQFTTSYKVVDGKPVIWRDAGLFFNDDKEGKPLSISRQLGVRPVFAAGNSDGDLQMLQWTTAGEGPRFGMIVHHTDAQREWAYDRESHVGRLDKALDMAPDEGWILVDMAKDWEEVWPDAAE